MGSIQEIVTGSLASGNQLIGGGSAVAQEFLGAGSTAGDFFLAIPTFLANTFFGLIETASAGIN